MSEVHVILPAGVDDPRRPSGGNVYDRRLCEELARWGWTVHEHLLPGTWPTPASPDQQALKDVLDALPARAMVMVDGLIASAAEGLVGAARQMKLVVLLHMALAEASPDEATARTEESVLDTAAAVITTSHWTRDWIITNLGVTADRVCTATPGADSAQPARGTAAGTNLLCAGPVIPAKGHDVLVAALKQIADLEWRCTCAGALDLDLEFVESVRFCADEAGMAGRLVFTGPLSRSALDTVRSQTDLVVSPSRRESYGMSVSEGLACAIPVIATEVGGHREAVGQAPDGTIPGTLIPPGDPDQLAAALRRWLADAATRSQWRLSAKLRSQDMADWSETARIVASALDRINSEPELPQTQV